MLLQFFTSCLAQNVRLKILQIATECEKIRTEFDSFTNKKRGRRLFDPFFGSCVLFVEVDFQRYV